MRNSFETQVHMFSPQRRLTSRNAGICITINIAESRARASREQSGVESSLRHVVGKSAMAGTQPRGDKTLNLFTITLFNC